MAILKTQKSNLLLHLLLFLSSTSLLLSQAIIPQGTIERTTKQQVLASIAPQTQETSPPPGPSQLFLTSPSGKYSAFLLRRETNLGAGGFGSDFCYIQVLDSGASVWESECTPVSNVNTCTLVLSDAGFEIFDGSNSAWDTDVDSDDPLERLELLDSGDMQMRDKEGELAWKASDNPVSNQNCGSIGAPGLSPAHPPFAVPIHGDKGPFGQPLNNNNQQPQQQQQVPQFVGAPGQLGPVASPAIGSPVEEPGPVAPVIGSPVVQPGVGQPGLGQPGLGQAGLNQPLGGYSQKPIGVGVGVGVGGGVGGGHGELPLVDNTPFDSGSMREKKVTVEVCFGSLLVALMVYEVGLLF